MKNKILGVTIFFSLVMVLLSGWFYVSTKRADAGEEISEYMVALNEIRQLNAHGDYMKADEKIAALQEKIRLVEEHKSGLSYLPALCSLSVLFFLIAFGYIYFAILRPFEKMKDFAARISAGDFEVPLKYQRSNYFGDFTWAFDSMRKEITKARICEKEAVDNNKTVIATLSHDIKTPIASIRAYAEALGASMDTSYEKRERMLHVITRKCEEVSRLTDDLLLHSIADLDRLKIASEKLEICSFVEGVIVEISSSQGDVHFRKPEFTACVMADKNRLTQIVENLINNAGKYAKSKIDVFLTKDEGSVALHVRDYGGGIPDENMPFIFDKFYRGSNCGKEPGSGLGLYIVKYLTEKMDGEVTLTNHSGGLEAVVLLPEYEG